MSDHHSKLTIENILEDIWVCSDGCPVCRHLAHRGQQILEKQGKDLNQNHWPLVQVTPTQNQRDAAAQALHKSFLEKGALRSAGGEWTYPEIVDVVVKAIKETPPKAIYDNPDPSDSGNNS